MCRRRAVTTVNSADLHWHTAVVTGMAVPVGLVGGSPLVVKEWRFAPRSVLAATFGHPEDALAWLEGTLCNAPTGPGDLGPVERITHVRERLAQYPPDGIPRYAASGYLVQDLISCRTAHGPVINSSPRREPRFAPPR